ncbi:hypothetical protein [Granulicella sp. dw_53]|uniref:hypothetical protein n=1 Tax=Granulicella sp. dw_53 TaxID=2719792 RepID=UPI001BD271A4|nr:hypothetical protein [Granulicella sp. dw_53]
MTTRFNSALLASSAALLFSLAGCSTVTNTPPTQTKEPPALQHIVFVGDSFTHGRYLPVRTYNNTPGTGGIGSTVASTNVVDENFGTVVTARQESSAGETGPWGGIPGIFAEFASEAGLPYDVHIEAISETSLADNYSAASDVITRPSWTAVVLQEATFQPIPSNLSLDSHSDPTAFCKAIDTIEAGVHAAAPAAKVFLYETGAPADMAYSLSTEQSAFSDAAYLSALGTLTSAYHDAYLSAATRNKNIAGIAPTGDAWALAWSQGMANPDPYGGSATGFSLTFNYQKGSSPVTRDVPTDPGFHHPSIYGAYLNALVLFQRITGTDARTLGHSELAAASLGISPDAAANLQSAAWLAVRQQNSTFSAANYDPCR